MNSFHLYYDHQVQNLNENILTEWSLLQLANLSTEGHLLLVSAESGWNCNRLIVEW